MRKGSDALYMTAEQLDRRILELSVQARKLPEGSLERDEIMKAIARFRIYADAKRWIHSSGSRKPEP